MIDVSNELNRARDFAADLDGLALLRGMLNGQVAPPLFAKTTDIWPKSFEIGKAVFNGHPSERFYNPLGTVHGGWIAALLDTAMACAVQTSLPSGRAISTLEMKTSFVRPVTADTGTLRCEGILVHAGARIAHAEGKVFNSNGELVAYGTESCMLFDSPRTNGISHTSPTLSRNGKQSVSSQADYLLGDRS